MLRNTQHNLIYTKYIFFRFAGVMDRNEASALLESRNNGTYLVRIRPQSENHDKFALSLK